MIQTTFDKIAIIKSDNLGVANDFMDQQLKTMTQEYQDYMSNSEFVETKEFSVPSISNKNITYTLNKFDDSELYILKNLRFKNKNDINKIKYIILEIGGSNIDNINSNVFQQLRKIYEIDDDNVIPFHLFIKGIPCLRYHEINCNIYVNDNVIGDNIIIQYDVYKNLNHSEEDLKSDNHELYPKLQIPTYQLQCNQMTSKIYTKHHNIQSVTLYCYNQIYYIFTDKDYDEYKLIIDDDEITLNPDDNNIMNLTPSNNNDDLLKYGLNFSKFENTPYLTFKASETQSIQVYCINWQCIEVMGGMAGTRYTN